MLPSLVLALIFPPIRFAVVLLKPKTVKEPIENTQSHTNSPDDKEPIRVILADDDKDDQQLFEEALDHTNVKTELSVADNGQDLMDHLHDSSVPNPDVIFLDINMPVKSGKECLMEIKSDEELKDIPCVVYSTSSSEKDINDTYNTGANLFVIKPVSFARIVKVLTHIFTFRWHKLFQRPEKKDFVVSDKH